MGACKRLATTKLLGRPGDGDRLPRERPSRSRCRGARSIHRCKSTATQDRRTTPRAGTRRHARCWTTHRDWARRVVYPNSAVHSIAPKTGYNAPISSQVGGGNTMVSHPCVSHIVLFVLIWLFVVLHLTRPQHPVLGSGHANSAGVPHAHTPPLSRAQTLRGLDAQASLRLGLRHRPCPRHALADPDYPV